MTTNILDVKETQNLSASTLSYTIHNIQATTKYTISVFAFTGKGPGPSISADIEPGVPPGKLGTCSFNPIIIYICGKLHDSGSGSHYDLILQDNMYTMYKRNKKRS